MLVRSSAGSEEAATYTQGACHVFAVALHRMTGWPIHLVLDQDERFWEDPGDCDNWIPCVVHAYCLDPSGEAWDVLGRRPLEEAGPELEDWVRIGAVDTDTIESEEALRHYAGCWAEDGEEPIERPLAAYDEKDILVAQEVAARVLGGVPGFVGAQLRP